MVNLVFTKRGKLRSFLGMCTITFLSIFKVLLKYRYLYSGIIKPTRDKNGVIEVVEIKGQFSIIWFKCLYFRARGLQGLKDSPHYRKEPLHRE